MEQFSLAMLAKTLPTTLKGTDVTFSTISIDTRTLKKGDLFIAIKGEHFDGHEFITEAIAKGAVAVIVATEQSTEIPQLQVTDTRKALGQIAKLHRQRFQIPRIAITGSSGKTTTKEMLATILRQMGPVLATKGNYNNDIGVPLTLLRLQAKHEFAVLELGANYPGEIAYTTQLVAPKIAAIINVAPAHIQGFGSIAAVANAKAEIFQGLTKHGIAVINADDDYAAEWKKSLVNHNLLTFACNATADFQLLEILEQSLEATEFRMQTPLGTIDIKLPLPGMHNVMNALAAATLACAVGASLDDIKFGLENTLPVAGRFQILSANHNTTVINDTYNANPDSVKAALDCLARYPGKRILVFGDMSELGPDVERYHQQVGRQAKALGIDAVYSCGQWSRFTSEAFGANKTHFTDKTDLIDALKSVLNQHQDVTLLIKGSRSAQMEVVACALTQTS